jgi:hypothetical protein
MQRQKSNFHASAVPQSGKCYLIGTNIVVCCCLISKHGEGSVQAAKRMYDGRGMTRSIRFSTLSFRSGVITLEQSFIEELGTVSTCLLLPMNATTGLLTI